MKKVYSVLAVVFFLLATESMASEGSYSTTPEDGSELCGGITALVSFDDHSVGDPLFDDELEAVSTRFDLRTKPFVESSSHHPLTERERVLRGQYESCAFVKKRERKREGYFVVKYYIPFAAFQKLEQENSEFFASDRR